MRSVRKQSTKIKTNKKSRENVATQAIVRAWDACACQLICNQANVLKQPERFVHVSFQAGDITISYQDRLD